MGEEWYEKAVKSIRDDLKVYPNRKTWTGFLKNVWVFQEYREAFKNNPKPAENFFQSLDWFPKWELWWESKNSRLRERRDHCDAYWMGLFLDGGGVCYSYR
jgi:hypothetical protein